MMHGFIFLYVVVFTAIFAANRPAAAQECEEDQSCLDAAAYNHRGRTHEAEGDYTQAIDDLTHAVRLAPDNDYYLNDLAMAYVYRAQAYLIEGKYEQALADLRQYVLLEKDNSVKEVLDLIVFVEGL